MAYILLLDESDVAARAMQGILARGNHTCVVASKTDEAWRMLRQGVIIDLVFIEPKLVNQEGLAFLQRVRDDWFWKSLPVVVYTNDTDAKQVRRALSLRVQNYLIKPYSDQLVLAEVAKAQLNPWRNLHFEEPRSFCAQLGLTPHTLAKMREQIMSSYHEAAKVFPMWAEERDNTEVFARLNALSADSEAAGVWACIDLINYLRGQAELDNWQSFKGCGEAFDYAGRLIYAQLNPAHVPEVLLSEKEREQAREAAEKAKWEHVDVDRNGPPVPAEEMEKQVRALPGCPVVDTIAANFQMAANGKVSSMTPVMELVARDPGLCAQVLSAANKLDVDDMASIEDPRTAATRLGELKLHTLAKSLPIAFERHMPPAPFTWTNYWMFLVGVARVSEFIAKYLELAYLSSSANTAGLLHDLGKLILLKLHPFGFQAIVRYAHEHKVPLREAERKHVGHTARDLGVMFAESSGLPRTYLNVIRWVDDPEQAREDREVTAIVALARQVCLHNRVGYCGEGRGDATSITKTPAWSVIQGQIFPSFDVRKFEAQAHAYCVEVRRELSGGTLLPRSFTSERAVAAAH